jgi:hypothetical protein
VFDPRTQLLVHALQAVAADLAADPAAPAPWQSAAEARAAARDAEPDLAAALEARDAAALRGILDAVAAGKRPWPEHDRDLLKRAMRAFRKRLGVTQLDDESTTGGGPLSGGRDSGIRGVSPPRDYPREIWLELARQGRLVNAGQGVFELGRGG